MSNTKEVYIDAVVPFDWASHLSEREAKTFCAWVVGCTGLELEDHSVWDTVPSKNGGKLTRHRVMVHGVEAVPPVVLSILRNAFEKQEQARILAANYVDLDDGQRECGIPSLREYNRAKRASDKRWEQRLTGVKFGPPRIVGESKTANAPHHAS